MKWPSFALGCSIGFAVVSLSILFVGMHHGTAGWYAPNVDYLVVHSVGEEPVLLEMALTHEMGHAVWYKQMSAEERQAYIDLFDSRRYHVSQYASTSAVEDFAETFEYAVDCKANLSRLERFDPERAVLMRSALEPVGVVR